MNKDRYVRVHSRLQEIKEQAGCGICGTYENLVFHHVDPETKDFGMSDAHHYSDERVELELSKCVVLCDSCHNRLHSTGNQHGKGNKSRTGLKHSLETRAKMSESHMGKPSPMKGHAQIQEAINQMLATKRAKLHTPEQIAIVKRLTEKYGLKEQIR